MHLTPKRISVYIAIIIIGVTSSVVGTIFFVQKTTLNYVRPVSVNTLATSTQGGAFSFSRKEKAPPLPKSITVHKKLPQTKIVTAKTTIPTPAKTIIIQKKNNANTHSSTQQIINASRIATSTPEKSEGLPSAAISIHKALVNIMCEIKMTGSTERTFGSGVFISPKGYIITNAHVAQYLLLKNYPHKGATTCTVRTGGPARARYTASIVFISSDWIYTQATTSLRITGQEMENGKHDIAILAVSGMARKTSTANEQVPTSFQFVPLGYSAPSVNEPVIIGSYAAQFLSPTLIETSLYPTIAYGSIKKLYTFASTTIDVATLGGTVAAQEGSSGGGILNSNNKLTALIVIGTVTGPTNTRNLAGITASYIRRAYASETGKSLNALLKESTTTATMEFSSTRKKLSTYFKKKLAL